ncbi:hypothetical protein [Bradyrhizobium liaoningense]|uniref:type III secretion apparatus assembly protein SctX n=1 Tax=Bradyrhizobium liaoningense TaxID=43992 RepID=UPI001BA95E90|nr:hypothetical protein [Bradyrhizobium liaoningense]MBR0988381.1 hypothetical protein [Bradyrhizobium liaoningense]
MRIRSLEVGLETISRYQVADDVHLPKEKGLRPVFLPVSQPLDDVLKRPSLDERLPALLQPRFLDPDLLEPATLVDIRLQAQELIAASAKRETGSRKELLERAATCLEDENGLDEEVRRALAALLRG